jgi:hypothetical protein
VNRIRAGKIFAKRRAGAWLEVLLNYRWRNLLNLKDSGKKKEAHGRITRASHKDESIFRVPQGSPPYRHKMSIPHYKSGSTDFVKRGWLTLSH